MQLPRLKEKYLKKIVPELKNHFDFDSVMQVPKIKKISINQGLGAAVNCLLYTSPSPRDRG